MTSEGLGEMFEGYSADTLAGKIPLVSTGGQADRQACADRERGPPSARAEILSVIFSSSYLLKIEAMSGLSLKINLFKKNLFDCLFSKA